MGFLSSGNTFKQLLILAALLMWGSAFSDNAIGGVITTFAGNGTAGYSGDGGPATSAQLNFPTGIATDTFGNLYIVDYQNNRIRKVTPGGVISTVVGNGTGGFSGDGGLATSAMIYQPEGVAADRNGNLYIADAGNNRIRKVTPGGVISTFAGNGTAGYSGDGGPAVSAQVSQPEGLVVDAAGNLYIADSENNRIRKVTPSGVISTVAGNGAVGFSGDGGPATAAQLSFPLSVALDTAGSLYIADTNNNRIRKVNTGGTIATVAGTGTFGYSGDGGPATLAEIAQPEGVALDGAGNLYIADTFNNRVREVNSGGTIDTAAGNGISSSSQLSFPLGVAVDGAGNLYIADTHNNRIQEVTTSGMPARIGSFAQVASGGGWKTTITLINLSAVSVDAQINLYSDNGSPMTLPLTFPQFASSTTGSSVNLTLSPNQSLVVESNAATSSIAVGWADVQATGALSGYSIFRLSSPGVPDSEGTVPLDTRQLSTAVLPYDNTNGYRTGLALANQASTAATVTATFLDQNGIQLGTSQISLPAFGHASFFADAQFSQSANQLGVIRFQSSSGITCVGLRFSPSGSFTSVPIIQ